MREGLTGATVAKDDSERSKVVIATLEDLEESLRASERREKELLSEREVIMRQKHYLSKTIR
jgi:hypothetical protein